MSHKSRDSEPTIDRLSALVNEIAKRMRELPQPTLKDIERAIARADDAAAWKADTPLDE